VASIATSRVRTPHPHANIGKDHNDLVDAPPHAATGRPPLDEPGPTGPSNGLADRPQAADIPAWRVLLAYARPYRLTLIVGGLLSLATGAVGLALPLTAKRLVDDLAQDRSVTGALLWLAILALANAGIGALGSYVLDRAAESVVLDARRRLVSHLVWLRGVVSRRTHRDRACRVQDPGAGRPPQRGRGKDDQPLGSCA
jgi:hypothetical protein